jgi:hypothetical protein
MSDSQPVSLPNHLWEALDLMSQEIGVGRDALVAQAVFTLARLNGYVVAGKVERGSAAAKPFSASPSSSSVPVRAAAKAGSRPPPRRAPEPEPEPEPDPVDQEGNPFDGPDSVDGGDYPQEPEPEPEVEPEPAPPPAKPGGKTSLTLVMAGRDPIKMSNDIITLGRGKTCDFVIDSNRVSREHARIVREGAGFALEDLNSSNGTFFGPNKDKVTKRPIRDGDEFTFGTEKVKFLIRR